MLSFSVCSQITSKTFYCRLSSPRQVRSKRILDTRLNTAPWFSELRFHSKMGSHHKTKAAAKHVLVPIGHGSEEIEAVCIADVLRRAGAEVTIASVEKDCLEIACSRGVKIVADKLMKDCATSSYDLIALPGGMPGAERLRDSEELRALLKSQVESGRLTSAICASPAVVLESMGLLKGKKATVHPAFEGKLADPSSVAERVVVDGAMITSKGPGTALEFSLSLVKQLYGVEKMNQVAGPMVMHANFSN